MKNRKIRNAKALTVALAALWCGAALAQTTNTLPTTYAYPLSDANTNDPGFIWDVSQVVNVQVGSIALAEAQLVGEQGTNLADPTQVYSSAAANATVPSSPYLPISFIIPGGLYGINFSVGAAAGSPDCSDNLTNLPCEDGMVGTPGNPPDSNGGTDNIAGEALAYLSLPQGLTTMGVQCDGGFELQIGAANPGDRYSTNAVIVAEYNGLRSLGTSTVTLNVTKAGLYAARLLYFQGDYGNGNVEWYTFPPAGTTNTSLGTNNTGTNAVLVGDVADSGIPAYGALTVPSLASYCSYADPSPGSTVVSALPTFNATIINGTVPVADIALTLDGTPVTATIQTTTNGATVSYSDSNVLLSSSTHTFGLTWTDNGIPLGVTSSFTIQAYVTLSPSQMVTPDTSKPGFKFNIFANTADYIVGSAGNSSGILGGESDNLDNIELGLNGLLTNGTGGFMVNEVTLANDGAAMSAAPALGSTNAPAEFVITNTINLTAANMPGFPPQDAGSDPSHSEVLTYVYLPVGLTTFTIKLDGFYRAFMGSWDYINGVQVGTLNDAAMGGVTFAVEATAAGYYPLRVTYLNLDLTPEMEIYATSPGGTNALVNDVAHGGLPAYYALSTPSSPYVRYASPRPVPRQVEYPNNRVLLRLQDRDNTVNDSSPVFNLDGSNVPTTINRVGDVVNVTWTATTLQTPAEIHSGILNYKDSAGNSLSNIWSFLNLKAVWLPTAAVGQWLPTNAVAVETFDEYTDPTEFTNGSPTTQMVIGAPAGQWYLSPQPENPLVDVVPIWTNVPAGPTNWFVWNWNAPGDGTPFDDTDASGPAYANFLCVDLVTFSGIEGDSANTAPFEMINGVPLTNLVANPAGNIFIAESDNRASDTASFIPGQNPGQTQFAMSKRFDLTGVTNPVLAWASIQKQNQDNINSVEYSIDGGATWAPVIYYLDGHKLASDPADLQVNPDNTVNVTNTLYHDLNPAEIPTWTDSNGHVNNTFASGIGAPISQALAPFFAPRVNDDDFDGKRIEVVRLPLAANQSNVRLRLGQIGSCSWYFGMSQIAFFDVPPSGAMVPTGLPPATGPSLSITTSSGSVNISWTGTGTLQQATTLTGKESDWSAVTPAPAGNSYVTPVGTGNLFFRLVSN
jgi:hypothetical protein